MVEVGVGFRVLNEPHVMANGCKNGTNGSSIILCHWFALFNLSHFIASGNKLITKNVQTLFKGNLETL